MSRYFFAIFLLYLTVLASAQGSKLNTSFKPGEIWTDDQGEHINAHGGGIIHYDGKYYWFGENRSAGPNGYRARVGVRVYSSDDLYNWKNEGIALKVDEDPNSEIVEGCIIERPKVIYNEKTGKFVMWFHLELKDQGYKAARTGVAISDNITGPYTFLKSYRPNAGQWPANFQDEWKNSTLKVTDIEWWTEQWLEEVKKGLFVRRDFEKGQMSRDMTLFVDDDGKAYHIHAAEENLTLHISELTDDYTDFTDKYITFEPAGHNEAPAICKYNGKYYMITSGCTGWDPNAARSFVSESIWGPWQPLGNPASGKAHSTTFESQSTYILPVQGKEDTFIFLADRWNSKNLIDSRYIWLPLIFEDDRPVLVWMDEWDLTIFNP